MLWTASKTKLSNKVFLRTSREGQIIKLQDLYDKTHYNIEK